jgi:DNA-binding MurR/RpiR family transcriptional regulator
VRSLVEEVGPTLSAAQRRVADLTARDPEAVAFGTTESVAQLAGTSGPTVVRFAVSLGFDGFSSLRDAVRAEVSQQLQSALSRVHEPRRSPLLTHAIEIEQANIEETLGRLDTQDFERIVALLADTGRRVFVLANTQCEGIGARLVDELRILRGGVRALEGNEFRVQSNLSTMQAGDVILSLDTQRHEQWLVRVQRSAVAQGAVPVILTDRVPCALDGSGGVTVTFSCSTVGPFESFVGLVALTNVIVAGVTDRRRTRVIGRLERLEQRWTEADLFSS